MIINKLVWAKKVYLNILLFVCVVFAGIIQSINMGFSMKQTCQRQKPGRNLNQQPKANIAPWSAGV